MLSRVFFAPQEHYQKELVAWERQMIQEGRADLVRGESDVKSNEYDVTRDDCSAKPRNKTLDVMNDT